jgi:hypothetical protein
MNLNWRSVWKRLLTGTKSKRESAVTLPLAPDQGRRAREAKLALQRSKELLEKVERQEPQVQRLHDSMKELQEQNGFAAMMLRGLGGGSTK